MGTVFIKVAGCSFRLANVTQLRNALDANDQVRLYLQPEDGNLHDPNAVKVIAEIRGEQLHVGYIPREHAPRARRAAKEGRVESIEILKCIVKDHDGKPFGFIQIKATVKPGETTEEPAPPEQRMEQRQEQQRHEADDPANPDVDLPGVPVQPQAPPPPAAPRGKGKKKRR